MKKVNFVIVALILSVSTIAQENHQSPKQSIGISYLSFGANWIYATDGLIGGPSIKAENFFGFGAHYIKEINSTFDLEIGLEYMKHSFLVGAVYPGAVYRKENVSLVNIPVNVRANFLDYFFINGGPILDFGYGTDNIIDNQNGIGLLLGAGVNYEFTSGISVFLNPNFKMHSLITLEEGKNRISDSSLRIGISYSLK